MCWPKSKKFVVVFFIVINHLYMMNMCDVWFACPVLGNCKLTIFHIFIWKMFYFHFCIISKFSLWLMKPWHKWTFFPSVAENELFSLADLILNFFWLPLLFRNLILKPCGITFYFKSNTDTFAVSVEFLTGWKKDSS